MFWERLYDLCIKKGCKPNTVAKSLGLSSATATKWKNGSIPNGEVLSKIADYLDCSVDYLLGRTSSPLTEREQLLLDILRELDEDKQRALLEVGKAMVDKK